MAIGQSLVSFLGAQNMIRQKRGVLANNIEFMLTKSWCDLYMTEEILSQVLCFEEEETWGLQRDRKEVGWGRL